MMRCQNIMNIKIFVKKSADPVQRTRVIVSERSDPLRDDPYWIPERIQEAIDKGQKRTIVLKKPVPVHILYLTAWADDKGTAYFGKDIYDRDGQLISALKQDSGGRTQ